MEFTGDLKGLIFIFLLICYYFVSRDVPKGRGGVTLPILSKV